MTAALNNKGLTLIELIISTILVGIVMMGVATFSSSIKSMQNTSSFHSILSIKTATAMNYLQRDASLAVGNTSDPGVAVWNSTAAANVDKSVCYRHADSEAPASPLTTADDNWVCYFYDASAFSIIRWEGIDATVFTGAPTTETQYDLVDPNKRVIIDLIHNASPAFFKLTSEPPNPYQYTDFTLIAAFSPNQACHPTSNPCFRLQARVTPNNTYTN